MTEHEGTRRELHSPWRFARARWAAWFGGIVLLGAILRFYGLTRYGLWYDEGGTFYLMSLMSEPSRLFSIEWSADPPLLPILGFFWYRLVQGMTGFEQGSLVSDLTLRLIPWSFSVATIPLVYALARELACSKRAALLAMLLTAVAPFHVFYAQEVRPYASMTFFGLFAFLCALRALRKGSWPAWAGMVVFLILSMHNHYFSIWYWFSLNLFFLVWFALHRKKLIAWTIAQALAVFGSLWALRIGFAINSITHEIPIQWYPELIWSDGLLTVKTFFAGYSGERVFYMSLFLLGCGLCAYGVYALRRRPTALALLLIAGAAPLVINLVLWQTRDFSFYQHRLFLMSSLMAYILAGAGIAALPHTGFRLMATAAFLVLTLPCLDDYYQREFHPSPRHQLGVRHVIDNRAMANYIREHWESGDAIAHISHITFFPIRHYYLPIEQKTVGWTEQARQNIVISFPREDIWRHAGILPDLIDTKAARATRIWLIVANWNPDDRDVHAEMMVRWLDYQGVRLERREFKGAVLYCFDLSRPETATSHLAYTADWGKFTRPRYLHPGDDGRRATMQQTEPTATGEAYKKDALGLWVSGEEAILQTSEDDWAFPVTIRNTGDSPLELQGTALASAAVLEPLAFRRIEPEQSVWQPLRHGPWNPNLLDWVDEFILVAELGDESLPEHQIEAPLHVAPGTYRVVLRAYGEVSGLEQHRAHLRFEAFHSDGRQEELGLLTPTVNGEYAHWDWFPIGTLNSTGDRVTIRVTIENPESLSAAYADMGRLIFFPEASETDPVAATVTPFPLMSGETRALEFSGPLDGRRRIDVMVYDESLSIHRAVSAFMLP